MNCEHCGKELRHNYEVYGDPGQTLCRKCNDHQHEKPRLLRCDSLVVTCASCGAWLDRYAAFEGDEWHWDCPKCGSSNVKIRDGRPFGPKSRKWPDIVKSFDELVQYLPPHINEIVICDPPIRGSEDAFDRVVITILPSKH